MNFKPSSEKNFKKKTKSCHVYGNSITMLMNTSFIKVELETLVIIIIKEIQNHNNNTVNTNKN